MAVLTSQYQEVLKAIRVPEKTNQRSFGACSLASETRNEDPFRICNTNKDKTGRISHEIENGTKVRNSCDEISDSPNPKAPPIPTNSTKSIELCDLIIVQIKPPSEICKFTTNRIKSEFFKLTSANLNKIAKNELHTKKIRKKGNCVNFLDTY